MTLRNYRSDILLILAKSRVSKDSRISERHIEFLINKYREVGIRQDYKNNGEIDPSWLLDTGRVQLTMVNKAEDLALAPQNVILGKYTLPGGVITLPSDAGIYRVSSSSRGITFFQIDASAFYTMPQGSEFKTNSYFFRIGDALYFHKNPEEANIVFIPADPMLVPVIQTEFVNSLMVGENYTVYENSIVSNGITYIVGSDFNATVESFTGIGKVKPTNPIRKRTIDDYYPMGFTIYNFVAMSIFTKDFKLEEKEIADIKNDNIDQLQALQRNT
jgi:hypothetical protein